MEEEVEGGDVSFKSGGFLVGERIDGFAGEIEEGLQRPVELTVRVVAEGAKEVRGCGAQWSVLEGGEGGL